MRFAVISNVHGNLSALRAVLDAIEADPERVDRVVCAGDLVGLGPHPNEVLDLVRERGIETVRGNYDNAVAIEHLESGVDFVDVQAEEVDRNAIEWTRRALSEPNRQFLQALPSDMRLFRTSIGVGVRRNEIERQQSEYRRGLFSRLVLGGLAGSSGREPGRKILVVHGTTRALNEFVRPDTANSILETVSREARTDVLISAHAGIGFQREFAGVTFIGPGSVAGPQVPPGQAEYAVVRVARDIEVDFATARYDPTDHLLAIADRGLPPALAQRRFPSPL